jgi:hypothetical protein
VGAGIRLVGQDREQLVLPVQAVDLRVGVNEVGEWGLADRSARVGDAAGSRVGAGHGLDGVCQEGSGVRTAARGSAQWERGQAGKKLPPIGHSTSTSFGDDVN